MTAPKRRTNPIDRALRAVVTRMVRELRSPKPRLILLAELRETVKVLAPRSTPRAEPAQLNAVYGDQLPGDPPMDWEDNGSDPVTRHPRRRIGF